MMNINSKKIANSPLITEFTKEIFEGFYHINFSVPSRQVIDTSMISTTSPEAFRESMMKTATAKTEPVVEGEKVYFVEGKTRIINGISKIQNMLNDPSISKIECQGPGTPLVLTRLGMKQFARISLDKDEIADVFDEFMEKANLPLTEGVIHVAVENFEMNGIYSELIRSNFIISRI
jgi:hypothetical protein